MSDYFETEEINLPPEAREAARLFLEAAEHAKAERFDEAVASAMRIESTNFKFWFAYQNEALVNICAKCADTGQIERALKISETVAPKYRSASLHWIAVACYKFGYVDQAFEIGRAITDDYVRSMTLRVLEGDE